jgi:hypothetical protein
MKAIHPGRRDAYDAQRVLLATLAKGSVSLGSYDKAASAACRAALEVATAKARIAGDTAFAVGVNASNVRKVTR